jgi:hypothetical protein
MNIDLSGFHFQEPFWIRFSQHSVSHLLLPARMADRALQLSRSVIEAIRVFPARQWNERWRI